MKTKPQLHVPSVLLALTLAGTTFAAGPYAPTNWPPTINTNKIVHYIVIDADPGFTVPSDTWTNSLFFATGGDQASVLQQVCKPEFTFTGRKFTSTFFNVGDFEWQFWNTNATIDILVQVYGDTALMLPPGNTNSRVWRFREGNQNYLCPPALTGGTKSANASAVPTNNLPNFKWNWLLISITNEPVFYCGTNDTGNRWVGSMSPPSTGNTNFGGINGGTLRSQPAAGTPNTWNGLIIHAMALGQAGAFGDPADINLFEPADVSSCDPVPNQNLVGIDFNAGVTNYLQVMNDLDQTVTYTTSAGPAGDLRKAVIPVGSYLNFGILSNRLGKPCNPNVAIKICVDFYDDPAFVGLGVQFGPDSYAVDEFAGGCAANAVYPLTGLHTLLGTGKWIRKSWTLPGVNLSGVNTTPLTGGPRFISVLGQVAVSRFEMAALRTTGLLAGQDPLAACRPDPLVCEDAYANYVELNLGTNSMGDGGITNGLTLGNNSADQAYVVETAGPAGDQRQSVRNADGGSPQYLNFSLADNSLMTETLLGPTSQGNCRLAIAVTYFDDPALAGRGLRAQTWRYQSAGAVLQASLDAPQDSIILQGSNTWREAYWEISRVSFNGVNQSPAATRFQAEFDSADTTKKIHINRVRYAVIRDCGTNAGVNLLATNFIPVTIGATIAGGQPKLSWPYHVPQSRLQGVSTLDSTWANFPGYDPGVATIEGGETRVFFVTNSADSQFFRLLIPETP